MKIKYYITYVLRYVTLHFKIYWFHTDQQATPLLHHICTCNLFMLAKVLVV